MAIFMQIFFPYAEDLNQSAQALDDRRLVKQLAELCQVLTIQYNRISFPTAIQGWARHPVVLAYDTSGGRALLHKYGGILCAEYRHRFGRQHQAYFTLNGLRAQLPLRLPRGEEIAHTLYIKGAGAEQQITAKNVSARYQALLLEKWQRAAPVWTRRSPPAFYLPPESSSTDIETNASY